MPQSAPNQPSKLPLNSPVFDVTFQAIGFTPVDLTEKELCQIEAAAFTETSLNEGSLPAGVLAVVRGNINEDDAQDPSHRKVFVSVTLRIMASTIEAAMAYPAPVGLLTTIADNMAVDPSGNCDLALEGHWLAVDVAPVETDAAVEQDASQSSCQAQWSDAHSDAAVREGWDIWDSEGSENGRWQVQRIDDPQAFAEAAGFAPPKLASDDEAFAIVANGTESHHVAARAFLQAHNPKEYQAVMAFERSEVATEQANLAPPAVQRAFDLVKSKFHEVTQVTFDSDQRWAYTDANGLAPDFQNRIDVGILEDAAESLRMFPVTFLETQNGLMQLSGVTPEKLDISNHVKRSVIKKAGYTICSHGTGSFLEGWYALLPGEREFFDNADEVEANPSIQHRQNYLGFFNDEQALLDEVFDEVLPLDHDDVAQWVGRHYGRNFDQESPAKRADWLERYIHAHVDEATRKSQPEYRVLTAITAIASVVDGRAQERLDCIQQLASWNPHRDISLNALLNEAMSLYPSTPCPVA